MEDDIKENRGQWCPTHRVPSHPNQTAEPGSTDPSTWCPLVSPAWRLVEKNTHTQTNKSFLATKSFRCYCEASLIYSNGQTESIMIHRQAAEISTSVQPGTPSSFSDWKRVEAGELGDWWWWRWWGWECVYRCREWKCPCEIEILRVREKAESTRETELNFDL